MAFVLLVDGHLLSGLVGGAVRSHGILTLEVVLAVADDDLGGSLDEDSDNIMHVGKLDSGDRSLQLGAEGDFGEDAALLACHNFVHGDLSILKPSDERDFGAIALGNIEGVLVHLNVGCRVVDDAFLDFVDDVLVELAVHEGVLARVLHGQFLSVEAVDLHLFSGHGSSLAHADIREKTSLLDGIEIAHKHVVMLAHLEDAVGKRNLDRHWQAFGDGDNEHDQGNHNVVNQLLGELSTSDCFVDADLEEDNEH